MVRHRKLATATALSIAFLVAAATSAQQTQNRQNVQQDQERQNPAATQNRGPAEAGRLDDKTSGTTVRASKLIGTNIKNSRGEGVGEVEDIVVDAQSGQIRYLAVSYGGFLGLGDDLFAVPYEAFKVGHERDDPEDLVLMLDVTQEQLDGAKGFNEDNWPNFADRNFTSELDRRYGVDRRAVGDRTREIRSRPNIETDREGAADPIRD
jgi:sporulation protein YlmC with PRC-barrel domain